VPILRDLDGEALARDFKPGSAITASNDGIAIRRPLPSLAGAILRRIDNQKTLEELHLDIAHATRDLELHAFAKSFASLFLALNGVGKMYLRMSPSARKG
jgi:hypothetical protein